MGLDQLGRHSSRVGIGLAQGIKRMDALGGQLGQRLLDHAGDVHKPQSLAHLGYPDMRVPISYALHYPERVDVPVKRLDLAAVGALTFEPVDDQTFSCLRLAREAGRVGGTAPCTLNAANEVAVHA